MKIFVSFAFLIASFLIAPTVVLAQDGDLEAILEELEEELGEDFEELLEDLDPAEIEAIEEALEAAAEDADNAGDLIDIINEAEGALGGLDGAGALADEARGIVNAGGAGAGGGGDGGGGDEVATRDDFQTICMRGQDCDLRGEPVWVRDEYGKLICIRGACPLNSLVIDYESVNNNVRDGIRNGIRESLSGGGDTIRPAWQTKLDQISRDPGFVNEARNSGKNPLEVIRGEAFRVTGFETRREAYAAGGQALAKG